MAVYKLAGYTPPMGIRNREQVKTYQKMLGVEPDGIWGPKSQKAYERYSGRSTAPSKPTDSIVGSLAKDLARLPDLKLKSVEERYRDTIKDNALAPSPSAKGELPSLEKVRAQYAPALSAALNKIAPKKNAVKTPTSTPAQPETNRRYGLGVVSDTPYPAARQAYGNTNRWQAPAAPANAKDNLAYSSEDRSVLTALNALQGTLNTQADAISAGRLKSHREKYETQAQQRSQGRFDAESSRKLGEIHYDNGIYDSWGDWNEGKQYDHGLLEARVLQPNDMLMHGSYMGDASREEFYDTFKNIASFMPGIGYIPTIGDLAREWDLKMGYDYNPGVILQPGDVYVYYSPGNDGVGGEKYYYRGDELLYSQNSYTMETTYGPHYFTYAAALPRNPVGETAEAFFSDAISSRLKKLVKRYLN